jgi:hypothetical protein
LSSKIFDESTELIKESKISKETVKIATNIFRLIPKNIVVTMNAKMMNRSFSLKKSNATGLFQLLVAIAKRSEQNAIVEADR